MDNLRNSLVAASLPAPSRAFITSAASLAPNGTRDSILSAARARLLSCDLADPASRGPILDPAALTALPAGIDSPQSPEARLPRPVHVQVLDVENLSASRWDQVEALEAVERGEATRGREIIRVAAADDEDADDSGGGFSGSSNATNATGVGNANVGPRSSAVRASGVVPAGPNATHRLLLQDSSGKTVFGLEARRVHRIGVGSTAIGEKMLLRAGTTVARGVVLLTPDDCLLLGGKVERLHKAWTETRLARLKQAAGHEGSLQNMGR